MFNKNKKAFSILELIVVISILSLLAAVAVPKLFDLKSGALSNTIKQDVNTISNSIQSYYMLENRIDKISDAVKLNEQNWKVSDKKLEFDYEEQNCITIEVNSNQLDIKIFKESSDMCQDIYDKGVRSVSYDLF
jgi:general secretion pathway protein G